MTVREKLLVAFADYDARVPLWEGVDLDKVDVSDLEWGAVFGMAFALLREECAWESTADVFLRARVEALAFWAEWAFDEPRPHAAKVTHRASA